MERDPLDLDTFLALEAGCCFDDPALRAPPTVGAVETLTRLGCPRWALTSKGVVGEVFDLLKARRKRGLVSVAQARLLCDRGHSRPWAVLFVDVGSELRRLVGRKEELTAPNLKRRAPREGA